MIRKAIIRDLDYIWKLYQSISLDVNKVQDLEYCVVKEKNGFIVNVDGKADVESRINNSTIFNVYEENNVIKGFIDINHEIYFPPEAENIIWLDDKLKHEYFHGERSVALHLITTDKSQRKKGIALSLFNNAVEKLRSGNYQNLFSIVTTGPITNCPSIIWHTKMGFKRVCITNPIDLFGLKNYSSLLFYKKIL